MESNELWEPAEHAPPAVQRIIGVTMALFAACLAIVTLMGHRLHTEEVVLQTDQFWIRARSPRAGGFAKDTTPFSEFLWADFLRRRIRRRRVEENFSASVRQAMRFAKTQYAHYLPGWCGPSS